MLTIFSIVELMFPTVLLKDREDTDWVCDLLRHPDIAKMDGRELGDLPFPARPIAEGSTSGRGCLG